MKKILFSLLMFIIMSSTIKAANIDVKVNSNSVTVGDNIIVIVSVNGDDADAWTYCLSYDGPVEPQVSTCVIAGGLISGRNATFLFKTTGDGIASFGIDHAEVLNYESNASEVVKGSDIVIVSKKQIIPVYRMYNPINGEHLYTTDAHEVKVIYETLGWGYEGIGWYSSVTGTPVYRLYNPKLGNHLYTSDKHEIDVLTKTQGWVLDNNGEPVMYSNGSVPIYRLFNEKLQSQHHLTTDANEYKVIPKYGWKQEGISMYALAIGDPISTIYY